MEDVKDILELAGDDYNMQIVPVTTKRAVRKVEPFKRPEGMHRELYALLCADGGKNIELAPLLPTDIQGGYKRKAKLGARRVRKWKWTPFTNPGRSDGVQFSHWRRVGEEEKEYLFAKFNKTFDVEKYSDEEYVKMFRREDWSRDETDFLFDLAQRFSLLFTVIHDRYNSNEHNYKKRSMEDLKERFYEISTVLYEKNPPSEDYKPFTYDVAHERKRKDQLDKLWHRTPEQVEEEEFLKAELKRIEARKRDRERKTQDLQKLITAADGGNMGLDGFKRPSSDSAKRTPGPKKRSGMLQSKGLMGPPSDVLSYGIKWPDFKNTGVSTRSNRIRLPPSVGQKKTKMLEAMLQKLGIDVHYQYHDEETTTLFNELRSDLVLQTELGSYITNFQQELLSLKHQYEASVKGQTLDIPTELLDPPAQVKVENKVLIGGGPIRVGTNEEEVATELPRKRRAALEQKNVLLKLKSRV